MRNLTANRYVALLLCLVLMFKVLVPVGYMPDFEAARQGVYKIRMCDGIHHQMDDQTTQDHQNHKPQKSAIEYCPFAGAHASAAPIAAIALVAIFFMWRRVRYVPATGILQSVNLSSAWPRGPPLCFT